MARVTVVVPAYNPGKFLEQTLQSIVEQTYTDWQAVIVDDGSTEDLSWVPAIDPRVQLVRQDNAGLSAARNRAITESESEYVAFLDADDVWYSRKLERQISLLDGNPRSPAAATGFDIIDAEGRIIGDGYGGDDPSLLRLLRGNCIGVLTVMARRQEIVAAGLFDLSLYQAQDWDLWLKLARRGHISYLADQLAGYRIHGTNMSGNYRRLLREGRLILNRNAAIATSPQERSAARDGLKLLEHLCGTQAYDKFRSSRRVVPLLEALRLSPRYTVRALSRYAASLVGSKSP